MAAWGRTGYPHGSRLQRRDRYKFWQQAAGPILIARVCDWEVVVWG